MQVMPVYKAVLTTGAMTCGSAVAGSSWAAVTAAYKVDVANPAAAITFPSTASVNSSTWTGTITGNATDTAGGSGIDTTLGKTQLSIHDDTSNQYWSGAAWGAVAGGETYFNPTTGPTAVAPGTNAPWTYTFASANLTVGHSYTIHNTTTDLAGNASAVASQAFAYVGASTAPTVVGFGVCANGGGVCSASANTLVVTLTAPVPAQQHPLHRVRLERK